MKRMRCGSTSNWEPTVIGVQGQLLLVEMLHEANEMREPE